MDALKKSFNLSLAPLSVEKEGLPDTTALYPTHDQF